MDKDRNFVPHDIPHLLNRLRVFPRLFMLTYMYVLITSVTWFQGLLTPTTEQAAFMSILVGAGAAWFGLYTSSKSVGK